MTEYVTIEPTPELASAFALYCLERDASVQTVSAGGFLVPLDWYPGIPQELLYGAYVDGFLYGRPSPQPTPAEPVAAPLGVTKRGTPRKRRASVKTTTERAGDTVAAQAPSTTETEVSE